MPGASSRPIVLVVNTVLRLELVFLTQGLLYHVDVGAVHDCTEYMTNRAAIQSVLWSSLGRQKQHKIIA